jgi:hypothetical protein
MSDGTNDQSELLRASLARPIYGRSAYRKDKPTNYKPAPLANILRIIRDYVFRPFRKCKSIVTGDRARRVNLADVENANAREELETRELSVRQDFRIYRAIDEADFGDDIPSCRN